MNRKTVVKAKIRRQLIKISMVSKSSAMGIMVSTVRFVRKSNISVPPLWIQEGLRRNHRFVLQWLCLALSSLYLVLSEIDKAKVI